jgi:hypothetical protein
MSPLPKASVAAGERGLARKARPWMITPEDFFSASEAVRARFAGLINAAPDDVRLRPQFPTAWHKRRRISRSCARRRS